MAVPSRVVVDAWKAGEAFPIGSALDWAAIKPDVKEVFFQAVDCDAAEPYKSFALFSEDEATNVANSMNVGGNPLNTLQRN